MDTQEEQLAAGLVGTFMTAFAEGAQDTVDGFISATGANNALQ